ncbi:MAG: molybdopterin-dependent oxidoreductase, partial [Eudoraea sp.]|nr:molybdopterin-dependent oxidoreductase [Eudoraea sp.]
MTEEEVKKDGKVSRRKFLVRGGLGTVGVLAVGGYILRNPIRRRILDFTAHLPLPYSGDTSDPMMWFELTEDNHIILHSPKVEMGQGTFTSLAQIAADELEVSFEQMRVVHAATATGNIDGMSTGGSTSVSGLWKPLRELAATMREMIKIKAADQMGIDISSMTVKDGVISANGQSIAYAEVAKKAEDWEIPETPNLKEVRQYQFVGKPFPRIDLEDKVYGAPIFGMDAELPDMLYGAVVRPEQIGAKFVSADASEAENMPGVIKVVQEQDFVGVVARSMTEAENAKTKIKVNWEGPKDLQQKDLEKMMTVGNGKHTIIQKKGRALKDDNVLTLEFRTPIGAHAQLEPNGVLASVEGDRATIIISTQVIGITRKEVAERLGLKPDHVNVIPTYLGGGFGRRLHTPHAVHAAVMS